MNDNNIGVILLVYNEEIHLRRCLDNLLLLTSNIYVIDSYSTDNTIGILNEYGISTRVFKSYKIIPFPEDEEDTYMPINKFKMIHVEPEWCIIKKCE